MADRLIAELIFAPLFAPLMISRHWAETSHREAWKSPRLRHRTWCMWIGAGLMFVNCYQCWIFAIGIGSALRRQLGQFRISSNTLQEMWRWRAGLDL